MLIRGIRGVERGVKPGVELTVRLGVGARMCTPLTPAQSMCQYRFQDAIRTIRPATGTMVTMATIRLQHVTQLIHTVMVTMGIMVTIRLLSRGVILATHIAIVIHRSNLQRATQTIRIATLCF